MRPAGVGILKLEVGEDIVPELATTVSHYLAAYPNHSVEIEVDTGGGDWAASLAIFTGLKNHRCRVTAIIRRAMSGGALIVMAADFREMHPHGHFFLHRPSGPYAKVTLDGIADRKAGLMAAGCRVPASRIRQWMDAVTTIDARRALEIGLVDQVDGLQKPRNPIVFL